MTEVPGQINGESTTPDIILAQPKSDNHGGKDKGAYNPNAHSSPYMTLVQLAKVDRLRIQQLRTPSNEKKCCSCLCNGK